MEEGSVRGIVDGIQVGPHGPFAFAKTEDERVEVITFSLQPPVWLEDKPPEEGAVIVLSEVFKKRAGWKAGRARFVTLEDEEEKILRGPWSGFITLRNIEFVLKRIRSFLGGGKYFFIVFDEIQGFNPSIAICDFYSCGFGFHYDAAGKVGEFEIIDSDGTWGCKTRLDTEYGNVSSPENPYISFQTNCIKIQQSLDGQRIYYLCLKEET